MSQPITKFTCALCGKEFTRNSTYQAHLKRKTPCNNDSTKTTKTQPKKQLKKNSYQQPLLKWVGGKTQIMDKVVDKFPKEMNNYHEFFLGGGSVLLALLSLQKEGKIKIKGKIYAYDLNSNLINLYKNIQSNKDELFKIISEHKSVFDSIKGTEINRKPKNLSEAKTSKESYYYWLRSQYNQMDKDTIECSALFLFLNKTCFRGVYREGPNGFNVPYGHYKNLSIISQDELNAVSDLIKNVEFKESDFRKSFNNLKKGDFVYLDPPYAPENTKSFVGYTSDGFNLDAHKTLFDEILKLNEKKIKFVMSNAKVSLVTDTFKDYQSQDILARRAINSKKPESTTTEIIIYN